MFFILDLAYWETLFTQNRLYRQFYLTIPPPPRSNWIVHMKYVRQFKTEIWFEIWTILMTWSVTTYLGRAPLSARIFKFLHPNVQDHHEQPIAKEASSRRTQKTSHTNPNGNHTWSEKCEERTIRGQRLRPSETHQSSSSPYSSNARIVYIGTNITVRI